MVFSILFGHIVELYSALFNYVQKFRPTTQILFGGLLGWKISLFIIFAFSIHIEFCSALWNYVRNVVSSNYVRQVDWSQARRNSRAVLGQVHFPMFSIIYSNYYQCLCVVQGRVVRKPVTVKDDFQSELRSLRTLMFIGRTRWNANRCYSLRTTYLIFETFQSPFPTDSLIFTAVKLFHEVIWARTKY